MPEIAAKSRNEGALWATRRPAFECLQVLPKQFHGRHMVSPGVPQRLHSMQP
jgi:hypothetical protein